MLHLGVSSTPFQSVASSLGIVYSGPEPSCSTLRTLSYLGGGGGATNDGRFETISLRRKTSVSAVVVICYFESDS